MIKLGSPLFKKLAASRNATCIICNRPITSYDADELEYIKTKRKGEWFIHTKCILKEK